MLNAVPGPVPNPETKAAEARVALLLVREFDFVWRFLLRLGVQADRVDDEAQRVFIIAADKLGTIVPGAERSYLVGTAMRVAANARRAQACVHEQAQSDTLARFADSVPTQEELLDQKRRRELLDRILDELSLEQRSVFVLSELEGMSREQIARALGLRPGTVASRLRLAKQHFYRLVARAEAQLSGSRTRSGT